MRPELFRLFDVGFPAYFIALLTGFLFATALGVVFVKRIGQNPDVVVDLSLAMLLWGVAGSRLLHVVADGYFWDYVHFCTDPSQVSWKIPQSECLSARVAGVWDATANVCHPKEADCFRWAKFWAGGLTYYGGFIGAGIAAYFQLKRDKFPFFKAADMAGVSVTMGLAFGRIGCLLAGCCFGARCELPWSLTFPGHSDASQAQFKAQLLESANLPSLPVHPTQIYESLGCLILTGLLMFGVGPRKRYDGQVFVGSLIGYALVRFICEIFRRDDRGGALGLSTSQLIGLGLAAFGVAIHAARMRQRKMQQT